MFRRLWLWFVSLLVRRGWLRVQPRVPALHDPQRPKFTLSKRERRRNRIYARRLFRWQRRAASVMVKGVRHLAYGSLPVVGCGKLRKPTLVQP